MKKISYFLLVVVIVFTACKEEKTSETAVETETIIASIPEGFKVTPTVALINPNRDTTISFGDKGTVLKIEANSFVDASGSRVTSDVAIEFSEYSNSAEMAFSGIPMTYIHEGEEMNFSSAGMFNLQGSSNGQAVQIAQGKTLEMDYRLAVENPDIDFYQLDESTNQWMMNQELRPKTPETDNSEMLSQDREPQINQISDLSISTPSDTTPDLSQPIAPVLAREDDDRLIRITIEDENLPEFKQYNKVMFRVSPKSTMHKNDDANLWHSFDIKKTKVDGEYRMILDGFSRSGEIIQRNYLVNPVFEGEDYHKAKKEYDKKLVSLEKDRAEQKRLAIQQQKEMEKRLAQQRKQMQKQRVQQDRNTTATYVPDPGHTFPALVQGITIREFGVYNCDQIYRVKNPVSLTAKYVDQNNKPIKDAKVLSLIDLNYNGAFSFNPYHFQCSATGKNVLVLFTNEGKVYTLDHSDFKQMNIQNSGQFTFKMTDMTKKLKSSEDLMKFISS